MRGCAERKREREREREKEWVAGCAFSIVRWLNSLISQIPGWTIRRPRWGMAATTHDTLCYAWSITPPSPSLYLLERGRMFRFISFISLSLFFFLIAWSHLWYVRYSFSSFFSPEMRRIFVREKVKKTWFWGNNRGSSNFYSWRSHRKSCRREKFIIHSHWKYIDFVI